MASCARSDIVRHGNVAACHVWPRCVRRGFLWGKDLILKKNFDRRRQWIRSAQRLLAANFAMEIGFRAEMSNHLHLVIRTRPDVVDEWTDEEVVQRWLLVSLLAKSRDGTIRQEKVTPLRIQTELQKPGRVEELRKRLSDPSYFMAILCEYIARRSSREDGCKGRFWESRFGMQELTSEAAMLVCGIYVDLNQIRAGEAEAPETFTHTSVYDRIVSRQHKRDAKKGRKAREWDRQTAGEESESCAGWMCELTLEPLFRLGRNRPSDVKSASGRRASDKGLLLITNDG